MDFKPKSMSINSATLETVELHREESMPDDKSPEVDETDTPKHRDVYQYSASIGISVFSFFKSLRIEILMFLYMGSYTIRMVSSSSMIMDKACLVHLGYSKDICYNLKDYDSIKTEVTKLANNYHVGHQLISMVPSAILGTFIGAWSDAYGRKPPIIAALIGIIIDGIGSTLCAIFFNSRIEFYYIPALFSGFSGGFIAVLTVLFSFISDLSTATNRTMKFALLEVAFGLAMPIGSLAGGWIYKFYGYAPVFMVSTFGHVLALVWVVYAIEETKGLDKSDDFKTKFKKLWATEHVVESYRASMKMRPNQGRKQILLLIFAMSFGVLTLASTGSITFLYVHQQYNWDNTTFSTISAIFSVIGTVSMLIVVPVFKKLKLGDSTLGITGSASLMAKNMLTGFAVKPGLYFLGSLLGLFQGLLTLAGRSRISKVTSSDDRGKVFSFLSTAELILPIIATAFVTPLFNVSLDIYPGLVFFIFGSLIAIPFGIFIWLGCLPNVDYERMHDSSINESSVPQDYPEINITKSEDF